MVDLSSLGPLTSLEVLIVNATGISDLSPLVDLYDAGAFLHHYDYRDADIDLRNCPSLEVSIQSGNQAAIAYLEAGGVRVAYDETFELAGAWHWWDDAAVAYGTTEYDEAQAAYAWEDGSPLSSDALEEYDNTSNTGIFRTTGPGDSQYFRVEWSIISDDQIEMKWTDLLPDVSTARSAALLEDEWIYWPPDAEHRSS